MVSFDPATTAKYCVNAMLPKNSTAINTAMTINVMPAFLDSGRLNTGTPLLIASMPVKAVQPAAKVQDQNGVKVTSGAGAVATSDALLPIAFANPLPAWTGKRQKK
jgi:hypothetical protein